MGDCFRAWEIILDRDFVRTNCHKVAFRSSQSLFRAFFGPPVRGLWRGAPLGNYGDQVSYVAQWITKRGTPAGFGQPVSTRPPFSPVRDLGGQIFRDRRAA